MSADHVMHTGPISSLTQDGRVCSLRWRVAAKWGCGGCPLTTTLPHNCRTRQGRVHVLRSWYLTSFCRRWIIIYLEEAALNEQRGYSNAAIFNSESEWDDLNDFTNRY
jgi:hypothetical protein